jgi:hypothetical protein
LCAFQRDITDALLRVLKVSLLPLSVSYQHGTCSHAYDVCVYVCTVILLLQGALTVPGPLVDETQRLQLVLMYVTAVAYLMGEFKTIVSTSTDAAGIRHNP